MEVSENLKIDLSYDLTTFLLNIYPKEMKSVCRKDTGLTCLSMHYSQFLRYRINYLHQWMNG
jgi:hypothetical protein